MRKKAYFIEGDGIGPEIWRVTRRVLDRALETTGHRDAIEWQELLAGDKAFAETGSYLPEATLNALRGAEYAIKGPLATPVGGGIRSLNVAFRQALDLYACIRPISYFKGLETPVKHPERVNMVVFRENVEDVYIGVEFLAKSPEAKRLIAFLRDELGVTANIDPDAAIGIKPMSARNSKRLVRRAIEYALAHALPSVTLMHKGNIQKFTEGGFRQWGYEVAEEDFAGRWVPEDEAENAAGRLVIKDRIADNMFQQVLTKPELYSVIATPNLNGDYLSDDLAAQVGGLGLAPGVNASDTLSFYEATHGTAPRMAGKDTANPGSLILSGAMMLEKMGFAAAAEKVRESIQKAIDEKTVPTDLARAMPGATTVGCAKFGDILEGNM